MGLTERVLVQPVCCKGRYASLDALLPLVGADVLLNHLNENLVLSLINAVGTNEFGAGATAEFLAELL